jgi:TolB-like protein/Tfp pilus assembly protein PilF
LGLPLAALLAWFYEWTPLGVKADSETGATEATRFTGRKIDFVIIGLLVLVAGFLIVDDLRVPENGRSIAVLPFENRNPGDDSAQSFAAGIHDDLLVQLSKLSGLKVISRISVERFTNSEESIKRIADTLGVATVLEGGVRIAGGRVRVNVRLVDATTETDLWAEIYDRELSTTNIFGIQSEIALNIVNSLQATLSPGERERLAVVPTQSMEAYEAYLLGKQEMARRTIASLEGAIEQFQRAIDLDARFALAYVGLADSYAVLQSWGYVPSQTVLPSISEASSKALELDGQLGEAYVSSAVVHELRGEYPAAEAAFVRAIELNPGYATAHSWYGLFLRWRMGRIDEAIQQAEQAVTLDPLAPVLRMAYGDVLTHSGRFEEASEQYRRSIDLDPQFGGTHQMLAALHLYAYGRTSDALEAYRDAIASGPNPDWIGDLGLLYLELGDTAAAEAWIEQAWLAGPDNISLRKHLAILNYYLGRDDVAEGFAAGYLDGPLDIYRTYMLFILRNADLRASRYAEARSRYEEFYPALAEADPVVHRSNYRAAIDLAIVLEEMGETRRSRQLLAKSLLAIRNVPRLGLFGYGSADADIYALQGKHAEALAALRAAIDDGWWPHWRFWTELNPNLDSIRNEPEYHALIAELDAKMAAELGLVRASENRSTATRR